MNRDRYIAANVAVLDTVPHLAGARLVTVSSLRYRASDLPLSRTAGYTTTRIYERPAALSPAAVVALYREALGEVYVGADHGCYKGGDHPRC